jgi:PKD repeat protein
MSSSSLRARLRAGVTVLAVAALAVVALPAPSQAAEAVAETPPPTVTADALPSWQINGVVWSQAIIGDTVYVTGSFTRARPPGVAAGGAGEVVANNIFAYRLSTGDRVTSFAASLNAQGLVIRANADGSRLYVGGDFTTVNGVARGHVAALNPADGSVITSFAPNVGGQVRGFGITPTTVFVGGNFTSANGVARTRLAAFQVSNGAMTSWAPAAAGGYVWAMTMSPDLSRVIPAGSFTTLSGQPAYGMGSLMASDASVNPWPAQEKLRAAGSNGAITSIKSDATQVYGTSYSFGAGASYEGTFALDPMTGQINWQNDCLGDTYDIAPAGDVVYNTSHQHDCTAVDGWTDTSPRVRWQKAGASYSHATGVQTKNDAYGWAGQYGFLGTPNAALLHWYPNFAFGSYTSSGQAGWAVDSSSDGQWLVVGGEFPRVNGQNQQGIVRFRTRAGAPNKSGPTYTTNPSTPIPATSAVSLSAGEARVSFGSAWDMDDQELTYDVLRNNATWVTSLKAKSNFWTLPRLGFVDKNLTPGTTYRYQVRITDSTGNVLWSPVSNNVTIGNGSPSAYADAVRADGAEHLWRLGEPSGTSALDWAGFDDATLSGGYTRGTSGALLGDSDLSTSFDGVNGLAVNSAPIQGPNVFSVETWFRTTSTSGGKIVGFGNNPTGTSSNYDRHIYMSPDGKLWFGVWNNGAYTVNTANALNDGQWHHAVGTMGPDGVTLYVDGIKIGTNGATSVAQPYNGYWRIGGDSSWNGNPYFAGDIDEVAIYPTELSRTQVQDHFRASGRTLDVPTRPADAYGRAVWDADPEVYFRLNESGGTVAKDSSPNGQNGVYTATGVTYGVSTPVSGSTSAVTFDGQFATGVATGSDMGAPPGAFTQELWFKTTTTHGGKLIGKGCSQTGNSGCYDRHVWMENSGQLSFGVWTGQTNIATSPSSYNDGEWHYMVASQGSDGMKLYVDGALVATNPQTQAEGSGGYWRIGGDTTWSGDSNWFAGSIDEVAVYRTVLSPAQISDHFGKGGGLVPNQPPSASFTASSQFLKASLDASGSADPDGTISSYAWDFGDGTTSTTTTATVDHTYGSAGTYTVGLTVKDDRGATASTTRSVTVVANQPPKAVVSASTSGLKVTADGTGSSDPDGSIVKYEWTFGDGATGSGSTASHSYAADGTYTVTLTVTDDQGATDSASTSVTVATPPNQAPTASFTTSASGATVSVDGSGSTDPDGTISSYAWDFGDGSTGTGATTSHVYAVGTFTITLTVTDNGGATDSTTRSVTVTDPVLASDDFSRTVANGWGSADVGGAWTVGGTASRWSVASGRGLVSLNAGNGYTAALGSVSTTSSDVSLSVAGDKAPTGGGQYVSVLARRVSSTVDYRAKLQLGSTGTVSLWVSRMSGGTETTFSGGGVVSGLTYAVGDRLEVRVQAVGTSPTTLRAKVWKSGTTEPTTWTRTATDSTAGFQTAGAVGMYYYLSSSATNSPVVMSTDGFRVRTP